MALDRIGSAFFSPVRMFLLQHVHLKLISHDLAIVLRWRCWPPPPPFPTPPREHWFETDAISSDGIG